MHRRLSTSPVCKAVPWRPPGSFRLSRSSPVGRSAGAIVKESLLTVAGVLGILSIVWFGLAIFFGLSIVIVLTGSMAPGLPAGSAIVVQENVPAAQLEVGDIVTVPRPGEKLPVTHRIVAIEAVPGDAPARSLTLQGDANATVDRAPYIVQTVQRSVIGFPGFGFAIRTAQSPLFMAASTLLIALAIVWAFWPVPPEREARAAGARRESIHSANKHEQHRDSGI